MLGIMLGPFLLAVLIGMIADWLFRRYIARG